MRILILLLLALFTPSIAAAETVTGLPIVVDGDSLRFPGTEVRVHGIDAPELSQSCARAGQPYACGREAKDAMRALINGRPVTCVGVVQKNGKEHDDWGRLLAKCRAGDTDLNAAMVESGHALAFRRYSLDYVAQEDRAREAKRGLWAGEFQPPWDFRRAKKLAR